MVWKRFKFLTRKLYTLVVLISVTNWTQEMSFSFLLTYLTLWNYGKFLNVCQNIPAWTLSEFFAIPPDKQVKQIPREFPQGRVLSTLNMQLLRAKWTPLSVVSLALTSFYIKSLEYFSCTDETFPDTNLILEYTKTHILEYCFIKH